MAQRICSTPGCGKTHRAKGYCSTCYNRLLIKPEERHRKVRIPCAWCGKPTGKHQGQITRYARTFCSLRCRDDLRSVEAESICPIPPNHEAHPQYRPPLPVLWTRPLMMQTAIRSTYRWVAGWCARCGSPFVAEDYTDTAAYCSARCGKATTKDRYRARKQSQFVADVWRIRIFERDGWRCKICGRPVDRQAKAPHPRSPVVDHIISLANGGTHEPANAQCAHFLCNSLKSDRDGTVQLALFG